MEMIILVIGSIVSIMYVGTVYCLAKNNYARMHTR